MPVSYAFIDPVAPSTLGLPVSRPGLISSYLPFVGPAFPAAVSANKTVAIAAPVRHAPVRSISPAPVPPCGRMLLNTFPSTYKELNGSSSSEKRLCPRIFPPIQYRHLTFGQISQDTSNMLPAGSVLPIYGACPDGWQRIAGTVPGAKAPWRQTWDTIGGDGVNTNAPIHRPFGILSNGDLAMFSRSGYPSFISGTTGVVTRGATASVTTTYVYDFMVLSDDLIAINLPPAATTAIYRRSTNTWTKYVNTSGTQYAYGAFCAMTPTTNKLVTPGSASQMQVWTGGTYAWVPAISGTIAGLYAIADDNVLAISADSAKVYAYSINPNTNTAVLTFSLAASGLSVSAMKTFVSNGRRFLYFPGKGYLFELTASGWVKFQDMPTASTGYMPTAANVLEATDIYASPTTQAVRVCVYAHSLAGYQYDGTNVFTTPGPSTAWTTLYANSSKSGAFGQNGEFVFLNSANSMVYCTADGVVSPPSSDTFQFFPILSAVSATEAVLFGGVNGSTIDNAIKYHASGVGWWEPFPTPPTAQVSLTNSLIYVSFRFGKYALCLMGNTSSIIIDVDSCKNGLVTFARKL